MERYEAHRRLKTALDGLGKFVGKGFPFEIRCCPLSKGLDMEGGQLFSVGLCSAHLFLVVAMLCSLIFSQTYSDRAIV